MTSEPLRGLYATNVFHYRHVLEAMGALCDDVALVRRFEVTPAQLRRARALPPRARALLERRVVEQPAGVDVHGLGAAQFLLPLSARTGRLDPARTYRRSVLAQSRRVARVVRGTRPDLFQFAECLGVETLRSGFDGVAVCERRHLHHAALEGDPGAVGDFPHVDKPDPVADVLAEEYERAHLIVVYSDVARRSFLERGFAPERVVVTPLGVPTPPPLPPADRRPARERHRIAYVGRTDAYKGIDLAVAAVERLGAPFHLHVAGPSSPRVLDWLATKPFVTHHGILGREALTELYLRSSVLLAPSIESFGYAPMEGAALGAHLVCADTTGAAEFLPADACVLGSTAGDGRDPAAWAALVEAASVVDPDAEVERVARVRGALEALAWDRVAAPAADALRTAIDLSRRSRASG
ncbi:glycosyltransferase [Nocardioides sp. TRM66260-LWL]|uniref:glycosyltransferase n=1 Tax=Nocardioides sp. TRM66260-LWL TaxID=2874478 RepID=UPI001CC5E5C9|nr:glycosyltransferase [Nocardioides sp. TRM66260-LWL]MBZ5734894.1 glycosyltransferase [Nocardioides sp. TRM66260-LWL]